MISPQILSSLSPIPTYAAAGGSVFGVLYLTSSVLENIFGPKSDLAMLGGCTVAYGYYKRILAVSPARLQAHNRLVGVGVAISMVYANLV